VPQPAAAAADMAGNKFRTRPYGAEFCELVHHERAQRSVSDVRRRRAYKWAAAAVAGVAAGAHLLPCAVFGTTPSLWRNLRSSAGDIVGKEVAWCQSYCLPPARLTHICVNGMHAVHSRLPGCLGFGLDWLTEALTYLKFKATAPHIHPGGALCCAVGFLPRQARRPQTCCLSARLHGCLPFC